MTAVGQQLRAERIRKGIELASLAHELRINPKYLEAIEAGDPSRIPGGFFYRSFVRQYAGALGLNEEEIDRALEQARSAEAPILTAALQAAEFPLKTPDPMISAANQVPGSGRTWAYVAMLIAVVAGCSAFYSWWRHVEDKPAVEVASRAPEPAAVVKPREAEVQKPAAAEPEAGAARPAENAGGAAVVPVAAPGTNPDDKVVIGISVRESTWLSITADGKSVFSGVLEPSQTKVLGGKSRTFIRVGNAGGLEITWNGKAIPPIGERGQVKSVVFTPENYQVLSPVPGSL